ncbi:MAG: DMT family transporter [Actinomyces urogenitalis]|uniref:DMT family permease n=1 Tax=Actinomyces urogenitalis DORA_12 TaxID=1403939 RepID=W1VLL5_9ACTO|nr:DMT family transporter [Actinomyces urogenitalis]ETJ05705.1 MAG: DMT family permease [Actinomyces urogenitalis DORA_12]MBS5977234.1 DMT family transporter [Actinomyces urogenitalis]MDK8238184.1 DMT family transporter [Actinomyces urogenitalis]MDK8835110.1 DMT family transporter [Actinomyces urogenitalis]MDU0863870.1 DMT family transporter [Actinomyces urogenitalis]
MADRSAVAGGVLIVVAMMWGSSFFMTKGLLTSLAPLDFLALRFAVAGAAAALVFAPRLARTDRRTWACGVVLGLVYSGAQIAQTYGLTLAAASVSGFLTALYVVGTPLVAWLLWKARPARATALAVALALSGAAVLGLSGLSVGLGEAILVLGAVGYSFHVALLGRWSAGRDPLVLAAIQMITLGVVHVLVALPGGIAMPASPADWARVLYLALAVGLIALVGQCWAQARMDAARAAVIMAMEPVFSALFAVAFGGELLTWRIIVGGSLIFAGSVVAELGPILARRRLRRALA